MIRFAAAALIAWTLFGNRKQRSKKVSFNKDKLPMRPPAKMTARMLLESALGEDHATHSVDKWGKGRSGSLQIVCTCGALAGVLDTEDNRNTLRNMREV